MTRAVFRLLAQLLALWFAVLGRAFALAAQVLVNVGLSIVGVRA